MKLRKTLHFDDLRYVIPRLPKFKKSQAAINFAAPPGKPPDAPHADLNKIFNNRLFIFCSGAKLL